MKVLCNQHGERLESTLLDPSTKEIKRSNLVLLNGQAYINLGKRLNTELKDGGDMEFCPVLAGAYQDPLQNNYSDTARIIHRCTFTK